MIDLEKQRLKSQLQIMRTALNRLDLHTCEQTIKLAQDQPSLAPILSELLMFQPGIGKIRAWNRLWWRSIRIRAIQTIARCPDETGMKALAHALINDSADVRIAAGDALITIGQGSAGCVVHAITSERRWNCDAILDSIEVLENLQNPVAGPILVRAIRGTKPNPSGHRSLEGNYTFVAVLSIPVIVSTALTVKFHNTNWLIDWLMWSIAGMFLAAIPAFSIAAATVFNLRHRDRKLISDAAAMALIKIRDPLSLPSLISTATDIGSGYTTQSAIKALPVVLASIGPEHWELLTGSDEKRLLSLISKRDVSLNYAIVCALRYLGTGISVTPVERLATRVSNSIKKDDTHLVREAQLVLPILKERQMREQASEMLLRASEYKPDSRHELLRPNSSAYQADLHIDQLVIPIEK